MKQIEIINHLRLISEKLSNIEAMLLIGSFGRNEGKLNSDIDVSILVNEKFQEKEFLKQIKKEFPFPLREILWIELRSKIVAYFEKTTKLEFNICRNIQEIDKYFLGSEISEYKDCILYDKKHFLQKYLQEILNQKQNNPLDIGKLYTQTVNKFMYDFEQFSLYHRRSDAYKTYFHYNLALNDCLQLLQLNRKETQFLYLPNNKDYFNGKEGSERLKRLAGTLYLPEVNRLKRELLNFFYEIVENQNITDDLDIEQIKSFLEWVFERDFFWNFRDISTLNPKIKSGIIYRAATMSIFQNESLFEKLLNSKRIKTIVDLRADREIDESPYNETTLSKINYVKAQLDPWNQPKWFKDKYHYGTNEEIAYRFFVLGCKKQIKKALEAIINEENAIVVHCFAGKDRTGIFISLLHLLVDTPLEIIYADYLASEVDVKPYQLEMVLNIIKEHGGIEPYLIDCGLKQTQIEQLKNKLLNGN